MKDLRINHEDSDSCMTWNKAQSRLRLSECFRCDTVVTKKACKIKRDFYKVFKLYNDGRGHTPKKISTDIFYIFLA